MVYPHRREGSEGSDGTGLVGKEMLLVQYQRTSDGKEGKGGKKRDDERKGRWVGIAPVASSAATQSPPLPTGPAGHVI